VDGRWLELLAIMNQVVCFVNMILKTAVCVLSLWKLDDTLKARETVVTYHLVQLLLLNFACGLAELTSMNVVDLYHAFGQK
jgi:hypothetical protein